MANPFTGVGGSIAVGPTSGGKIYGFNNLGTSPQVVAPANPQRTSITFHNPGTINLWVFPSQVQALNSIGTITNQVLTPSLTALGGGFLIYANGGQISFYGECTGSWQALAASGTTNSLTVSDNNV